MLRSLRLITTFLVLAVALAACGSGSDKPTPTITPDPRISSLQTAVTDQQSRQDAAEDVSAGQATAIAQGQASAVAAIAVDRTQIARQDATIVAQGTQIADANETIAAQATESSGQAAVLATQEAGANARATEVAGTFAAQEADANARATEVAGTVAAQSTQIAEDEATIAAQSTVIVYQYTVVAGQSDRVDDLEATVAAGEVARGELETKLNDLKTRVDDLASRTPVAQGSSTPTGEVSTTVEVNLVDIAFEPTELTIPADVPVTIKLVNRGAAQHNLQIQDTEYASANLNSGETEELTVNLPAGDYEFVCTIPGHKEAGMVGVLHVVKSASPTRTAPTPRPTVSGSPVSEADYVDTVDSQLTDLTFTLDDVATAINDPNLATDTTVQQTLLDGLDQLQALYESVRDITPPARYAAFHADYLSMMSDFNDFATALEDCIGGDDVACNDAGTAVESAIAKLDAVMTQFLDIRSGGNGAGS